MKKYLLFISFVPLTLYSQNFERSYTPGNASCIIQKDDSSFIVGIDDTNQNRGLLLVSATGDSVSYKPTPYAEVKNIVKSRLGGYLQVGQIRTPYPTDACLIRLDDSLDSLWMISLGGSYSTFSSEIIELPDSSILVTRISPAGMSYFDLDVFRLDMNGNILWTGPYLDSKSRIYNIAYGDSEVYTASITSSHRIHLLSASLDSGTIKWSKEYYDTMGNYEYITNSMILSGSSLYIAGEAENQSIILKTDLNGDSIWMKFYNNGIFSKIISVSPNSFYAAGQFSNDSVFLLHLDSNGTTLWERHFCKYDRSYPFGLISTSDGGVAFCGSAYDITNQDSYTYVVKTDSAGNVLTTYISKPATASIDFIYDSNNKMIHLSSEMNSSGCTARIHALNGQLIHEEKLASGENTIDVQHLSHGEYIISVIGGSDYGSRKFIVK